MEKINNCEYCKEDYKTTTKRKTRFCSKTCALICRHKLNPKQTTKVEKNCQICQKGYLVIRSDVTRSKYCSRACQTVGRTKPTPDYRFCKICKVEKPIGAFTPNKTKGKRDGRFTFDCSECRSLRATIRNRSKAKTSIMNERSNRSINHRLKAILNNIKGRAEERGMEFSVSAQFLENLWMSQNKRCALTDLEMTWELATREIPLTHVSIDRIDNTKGYTEQNIQLVCFQANIMKQKLSMEDFVSYCGKVVETYNRKVGKTE